MISSQESLKIRMNRYNIYVFGDTVHISHKLEPEGKWVKYSEVQAVIEKLQNGNCLKCNMGPLRESCAYPEACQHPGRELSNKLNQVLLKKFKE